MDDQMGHTRRPQGVAPVPFVYPICLSDLFIPRGTPMGHPVGQFHNQMNLEFFLICLSSWISKCAVVCRLGAVYVAGAQKLAHDHLDLTRARRARVSIVLIGPRRFLYRSRTPSTQNNAICENRLLPPLFFQRGVCLSNWINKPKKSHFRNLGIADKQMG